MTILMKRLAGWIKRGRRFGLRVYVLNVLVAVVATFAAIYLGSPRVPRRIGPDDLFWSLFSGPFLVIIIALTQLVCAGVQWLWRKGQRRSFSPVSFLPGLLFIALLTAIETTSPARGPFEIVLEARAPASVRNLRCDGESTFGDSEWVLTCALAPRDLDELLHTHPYQLTTSNEDAARLQFLTQDFLHQSCNRWGKLVVYRWEIGSMDAPTEGRHGTVLLAINPAHDRLIGCYASY